MAFETTKQVKFVASVDGTDKVRAGFRSIGDSMSGLQRTAAAAGSALAGFAGAAGAGVFLSMINGAIDAKAKLYDLSLQTGISVEKLGGLSKVALLSGTDMATVASASNKLGKALATTNEDSEGATQGLKALGLNFKEFKDLAPEEQMLAVAKAMEGFADGTGKSAAAMLLFGKSGAELLPFMKELAERGIMVSKQTTAGALAAKEFGDNMILLRGAGEGWATSLANTVLPSLVELTKQLVAAQTPAEKLWVVIDNMKENTRLGELKNATVELKQLNAQIAATQRHIEQLEEAKRKPRSGFNAYGEAELQRETQRLAELTAQAAKMSDALKRLANTSQGLPAEGPTGPTDTRHFPSKPKVQVPDLEAAKAAAAALKKLRDEERRDLLAGIDANVAAWEQEAKTLADFQIMEAEREAREVARLQAQGLRDMLAAIDAEVAAWDDAARALADFQIEQAKIADSKDPLIGSRNAIKSYLADVEAAGLATERAVGDAIRSLEDGLTQLFTKGTFDARAFVDQLIAEFVRLRIVKPLLKDIFETGSEGGGNFWSALVGLFSGGGGVGSEADFTTTNTAGARATGGPVSGGSAYMVGESGPELFVPNSGGAIVPNSKLGVAVTYAPTINIDSRSDRAQVAQQTARAVQEGNKQLVEMLRARGVM